MNNQNTYENPLQDYWVYDKAQKNSLDTKVTISFFLIRFSGTGGIVYGAENPEDDIKYDTCTRPLSKEEIGFNAQNICYNHNEKHYLIICTHIKELEILGDEYPESSKLKNKLKYLSDAKMHYANWFNQHSIPLPTSKVAIREDCNPAGNYSVLQLGNEEININIDRVRQLIEYIFTENADTDTFNGCEVLNEYFPDDPDITEEGFAKFFKIAGDKYHRLRKILFLQNNPRSREYYISPAFICFIPEVPEDHSL